MDKINAILTDIKKLNKDLNDRYARIISEIESIFFEIRACKTFELANPYFDVLQKVQSDLIELSLKENIKVNDRLWEFIKEFDRIDDLETRIYFYNKIKLGERLL